MTKREYVFKFLDKVKWHWEKEPIIRDYLSKNDDEAYVEYLYGEFTKIVNNVLKEKEQKKVSLVAKHLETVKKHEKEIQEADLKDLENLEELINHL
jgi:predicted RNA-binding protein